jgi:uncharacterized membrane protein
LAYVSVKPGQAESVATTIQNVGNILADGTYSISMYASDTDTVDSSSVLLDATPDKTVKLKSGALKTVHVSFTAPADAQPGTYYLVAQLNPSTSPADTDVADKIAAVPTF